MGKGKIAPDVGAEPIGTSNEEVASDAGEGPTGAGEIVVPPNKGSNTVGTGESSAMDDKVDVVAGAKTSGTSYRATDDEVDPVAGAGSTGLGEVVVPPSEGTVAGESSGATDDKMDPVTETKTSGTAEENNNSPHSTENEGAASGTPTGIEKLLSVRDIKARTIAEKMYGCKCTELDKIQKHVDDVIAEERDFFAPVETICPNVNVLFAHVLLNQVRRSVKNIDGTLPIHGWGEEECKNVGRSFALFVRKRKTGDVALDAWRRHFVHLKKLFDEVDGFEELMLVLANNLLRDR